MTSRSISGLRASLSVLAAAVLTAGCAAPAAQESQAPSNAVPATPSVSASASSDPTLEAPTPTATSEPTAAPTPMLAFEAPAGILPMWALVDVVVDNLQLRAAPGLTAAVTGTAQAGQRFQVVAYDQVGPIVEDGLDWYRLATAGDAVLWAASGSDAGPFLELVPPNCPETPVDLLALGRMTDWERLACFGDRPLTVEGTVTPGGGAARGTFEPRWLAFPAPGTVLVTDYPEQAGSLGLRVPPDSQLDTLVLWTIVRVTGHFNDSRSAGCSMTRFDGAQDVPIDPRAAQVVCRERFVVDAFEVIGTEYPVAP